MLVSALMGLERMQPAYAQAPLTKNVAQPFNQLFGIPRLTLPDGNHTPSQHSQSPLVFLISNDVTIELGLPEVGTSFRCRRSAAAWMPMPEAAVYENGCHVLRQNDIRRPWKVTSMKSEAQLESMKELAYADFWPSVGPADGAHDTATGGIDRTIVA